MQYMRNNRRRELMIVADHTMDNMKQCGKREKRENIRKYVESGAYQKDRRRANMLNIDLEGDGTLDDNRAGHVCADNSHR